MIIRPASLNLRLPLLLLSSLLPAFVRSQIGTTTQSVPADSSQLVYTPTWGSQTLTGGTVITYSNATTASVTFSFIGVGCQYIAAKKYDRGYERITLDGATTYTVDLYSAADSGDNSEAGVYWTSPTLTYGTHTVRISQIGVDSRLGFYPYLFVQGFIEVIPINVASYTATQNGGGTTVVITTTTTTGPSTKPTTTSPTTSTNPTPSPSPNPNPTPSPSPSNNNAAVIGGAVGGVVGGLALLLVAFFLIRRSRNNKERDAQFAAEASRYSPHDGGEMRTSDLYNVPRFSTHAIPDAGPTTYEMGSRADPEASMTSNHYRYSGLPEFNNSPSSQQSEWGPPSRGTASDRLSYAASSQGQSFVTHPSYYSDGASSTAPLQHHQAGGAYPPPVPGVPQVHQQTGAQQGPGGVVRSDSTREERGLSGTESMFSAASSDRRTSSGNTPLVGMGQGRPMDPLWDDE
ncbi:hypothetical protein T439DRAFT_377888 [Meredithblackwellia eburnea MCA 4105]